MNEIMNISGVDCYEKDGTAYLKLETVVRGLGFTRTAASGNEVVMWSRVEGYLKDLGVHTSAHDGFIPENIFYRLAMKAKNEAAEKFQALVADEIIPSIRKTGAYGVPRTTAGQIQLLAKGHMELEQKIDSVNDDLQDFKRTMPLLAIECQQITDAKNRKVVSLLGGKNGKAYKNASLRGKVYRDLEGQLRREFDVRSYKAIHRNQTDKALEIINKYELPLFLADLVAVENAQISM